MLNYVIDDEPNMKICDIEFSMQRPSYTINTLNKLNEIYPEKDFSIVIGMDNLQSFHKWKNHEYIIKNFQIIVYPRNNNIEPKSNYKNIKFINAPLINISSQQIRKLISKKQSVSSLIPQKTLNYIIKNDLYI
jgi:nicotinate-nucleotide adenylyltransferase